MTLWSVVVTHLTTVAPLETRRVCAGGRVAVRSIVRSRWRRSSSVPPSMLSLTELASSMSCFTVERVVEQAGLALRRAARPCAARTRRAGRP